MATYRKRGEKWEAIIRRFGLRETIKFTYKAEAIAWAEERERVLCT